MPHYLVQGRYTPEGWAALVKNPHDRTEAVRPVIERLGGRYEQGYFTDDLGAIVAVCEFPDDRVMAQLAAAVRASSQVAELRCTRLISTAEAVELFQQAGAVDYQAPA
ncbi:MAG: GYD domain-containing protein [Acidimicrobiia bacterium]